MLLLPPTPPPPPTPPTRTRYVLLIHGCLVLLHGPVIMSLCLALKGSHAAMLTMLVHTVAPVPESIAPYTTNQLSNISAFFLLTSVLISAVPIVFVFSLPLSLLYRHVYFTFGLFTYRS